MTPATLLDRLSGIDQVILIMGGWVLAAYGAAALYRRLTESDAAQNELVRRKLLSAACERPISCGCCRELTTMLYEVVLADDTVWVCSGCAELLAPAAETSP